MKGLAIFVLLLTTALAQVTIAPLFPIAGAIPELPLLVLTLLAIFAGPNAVMLGMPTLAILYGFASDRSPALLVVAYLPLLPFAAALEGWRIPLWEYPRLAIAILISGLWIRGVLSFAAVAQGAHLAVGPLIFDVLAPGAFLDLALLTVAYAPLRLIGWGGHQLSLQRSGY